MNSRRWRVYSSAALGIMLTALVAGTMFEPLAAAASEQDRDAQTFLHAQQDLSAPEQPYDATADGEEHSVAPAPSLQHPDPAVPSTEGPERDGSLSEETSDADGAPLPAPVARVEADAAAPLTVIPAPDGVRASMRRHQGYTGKNGSPQNSQRNAIRYGHALNSITSGTIPNQGGSPGTGSPIWYSDGYSAWVRSGSTAYSAHGHAVPNPGAELDLAKQSALGFAPADVRSVETGQIFNLGRMVHRNNPVQLANEWFQGDLEIQFLGMELDYRWRLDETPNNKQPPSHPDNDDYVDFLKQVGDQTFMHNGLLHTLVVHGFTQPNGQSACEPTLESFSSVKNEFRTTEGRATYGCLYASVEQVRNLTIEKVTETPYGEPPRGERFPFTAASSIEGSAWQPPANASFTLAHGERKTAPYNTGERLAFTESPLPADWRLRDIACVDGKGDVLSGVHTDLGKGELVVPRSITADNAVSAPITCTFTNVFEPRATLTLHKRVVSDGQAGEVAQPDHWTLTAKRSGSGDPYSLTGTHGVSSEVMAGTYRLSEEANTPETTLGYAQTGDWECRDARGAPVPVRDSSVTLQRNEHVTCTATNTYQTGELSVRKALADTVPAGSGDIDFTGDYRCTISGASVAAGSWASYGEGVARLTPAAGTPDPGKLPVGATCEATEHALPDPGEPGLPNASWRWSPPSVSDPVTITRDATAELVITNTAEHEVGSVTWTKQGETEAALAGSAWELGGPEVFADEFGLEPGAALTVTDCERTACPGPDQDSRAGSFHVKGLPVGEYELRETVAPPGYELLAEPIVFSVGPGGSALDVALNPVINRPQRGPEIPLTGGIGRDFFTIAGLAVLGGGGAGLVADKVRRRRAVAALK